MTKFLEHNVHFFDEEAYYTLINEYNDMVLIDHIEE